VAAQGVGAANEHADLHGRGAVHDAVGGAGGRNSPNRGQVASNIVQGIGFLGAGLILHTRNRVLGLTSAATVWVVAAIGMACGAGLYVEAAIATGLCSLLAAIYRAAGARSKWKSIRCCMRCVGPMRRRCLRDPLQGAGPRASAAEYCGAGQVGEERVTFHPISASSARHKNLLAELVRAMRPTMWWRSAMKRRIESWR
jgi:putative Mg2+ transporter-C (MgtC) family protein